MENRGDVRAPFAKGAEDVLLQRVDKRELLLPGVHHGACVYVLEVQVPDGVDMLADERGRVPTAIRVMPGIEAERDTGCVQMVEQRVKLMRSFDPAADVVVVVDGDVEAPGGLRKPVDAVREPFGVRVR